MTFQPFPSVATIPIFSSPGSKLPDDKFRAIRDFIYSQCGIFFTDNKKYLLEGRLAKRLDVLEMKDYDEYLNLIRYGSQREEEMEILYESITINETSFFRNEPQFNALETQIVNEIILAKKSAGKRQLHFWSSACSSGEEAYTMAMIYLEKIKPRYPGIELEIVGTDINSQMLELAQEGVYRDYSIRNTPKLYLDKYFSVSDGRYYLNDDVKRLVRFQPLNLYDQPQIKTMSDFDIIFCCNVLIYFDMNSKKQVIADLYNSLNRGGYLFIGYSESLHGITKAFKLVHYPKTLAYKKE
jgi:chemotaxis protein methyltransferase CheR